MTGRRANWRARTAALANQERRKSMTRSGPDAARCFNRRQALRGSAALGLAAATGQGGHRQGSAAPLRQTGLRGGGGTLIAAIADDPVTFNLNLQPDPNATIAARNTFRSLVTFDLDYTIQPDLAEEWSISDDGLVYTFELERGATWHDGESVAASDVQTTLERLLEDDTAPAHAHLAVIASIETTNDRTVTLTLNAPSTSLLAALAHDWAFILPAHLYLGGDWRTNPANLKPVGAGPFRMLSATPGGSVDLGAFHEFTGRGPFLDRLLLQVIPEPERAVSALLNGEIDLITYPLPAPLLDQMRQEPGFTVSEIAQPRTWFLGLNLSRDLTRDPGVRQRLARAINRDQLVSAALGETGLASTSYLPPLLVPGEPGAPTAPTTATSDSTAGAPEIASSADPITLTLLHDVANPTATALAAALREQFQASNISLDLAGLDQTTWQTRLADGDFDLALIDGPRWPDPSGLRDLVGSDGRDNFWAYANPEVDDLFAAANETTATATRAAIFAELEQVLAADPPLLPLVLPSTPYVFTNRASGLPYVVAPAAPDLHRFNLARMRPPTG